MIGRGAVLCSTDTVPSDADILVSGNVVRNSAVDTVCGAAIWFELTSPSEDCWRRLRAYREQSGRRQRRRDWLLPISLSELAAAVGCAVPSRQQHGDEQRAGYEPTVEALSLHGNIVYGTDIARLEEALAPSALDNVFGKAPPIPGSAGNIFEDPQFVDPTAVDYHLAATSPARDAGTSTLAASFDLDGRERDAMPDAGAHEVP